MDTATYHKFNQCVEPTESSPHRSPVNPSTPPVSVECSRSRLSIDLIPYERLDEGFSPGLLNNLDVTVPSIGLQGNSDVPTMSIDPDVPIPSIELGEDFDVHTLFFEPDVLLPSIELEEDLNMSILHTSGARAEGRDSSISVARCPTTAGGSATPSRALVTTDRGVLIGYWSIDSSSSGMRPVYISTEDWECTIQRHGRLVEVRYGDFDPVYPFVDLLEDIYDVQDEEEITGEIKQLIAAFRPCT
ncbi:hypothetical protein BDW74DRAFT_183792 [Aspergillus multicolor]|uniref:uncharacterized protein n=1 Tax=Aspergillus multicolor TaxID=41759 RepID=UPI003CCCB0E2